MTLTEMVALVRDLANARSPFVNPDAELKHTINQVMWELAGDLPWPQLKDSTVVSTVVGQESYALPVGADRVTLVSVRDPLRGRLLRPFSRDERDLQDRVVSGEPTHYFREGGNLFLWPVPDRVEEVTVEFLKVPAELDDSDEPDWMGHEKFHMLLVYGAALRVLEKEGDSAGIRASYMDRWIALWHQFRVHWFGSHDEGPVVVGAGSQRTRRLRRRGLRGGY